MHTLAHSLIGLMALQGAASQGVQATQESVFLLDENVLDFALDACGEAHHSSWEPAPRNDYLDSVISYHHDLWNRSGARGGLAAYELWNEDGYPIDFQLPSGEPFEAFKLHTVITGKGAVTRGCAVHLSPYEALSMEEMQNWSRAKPEEMLLGVRLNEQSWQLIPPDGSGWEYAIVSYFDPSISLPGRALPYPFRGLIIRFTKTEF